MPLSRDHPARTELAPHLGVFLRALRACLTPHGAACVCAACTALQRAETELEALTMLALVVQAEAAHERAHPPEEGRGWGPVWQAYTDRLEGV